MKTRRLLVSISLLLPLAGAHAQGGPPLVTDDPWTPDPYHWEINTAWTLEKGSGYSSHELPIADFNYGWGDHVQLKFEVPLALHSEAHVRHVAIGNPLAGVKWRFLESLGGFAVATYPQLQLPRSERARRDVAGSTSWAFLLPIEIARALGPFNVNVDFGHWFAPEAERSSSSGLAISYQPRRGLEIMAECNAEGAHLRTPGAVICGAGARADLTARAVLLLAFEPYVGGNDPDRPRFRSFVGVQAHMRGRELRHRRQHRS